jgi:Flp pilus assembly protein TadG
MRWTVCRASRKGHSGERGAAVVDLALVVVVLVPLFLGIIQVALVMHVRNSLAAAASEGARFAATIDRGPGDGVSRTRELIEATLADRYAGDVTGTQTLVDGYPGVVVAVHAEVPALGLWGPAVSVDVTGHAVEEDLP